jgi:hypothetical protein
MRPNYGEGNGVRLAGRIQHSTDRIDRTTMNVVICRAILRLVLGSVYRPPWDGYRPLP